MGELKHVHLDAWHVRMERLLDDLRSAILRGTPGAAILKELTTLHNSREYMLLYAEASDQFDREGLEALREFSYDAELTSLLEQVDARTISPEERHLLQALTDASRSYQVDQKLVTTVEELLRQAERSQRAFLAAIDIQTNEHERPGELYLSVLSADLAPKTRHRIVSAWSHYRREETAGAWRALQPAFQARHAAARANGFASAAEGTFSTANISIENARSFLHEFTLRAIEDSHELGLQVQQELGVESSIADLPRVLRTRGRRSATPTYDARGVLKTATDLAQLFFEVQFVWGSDANVPRAEVYQKDNYRGELLVDRPGGRLTQAKRVRLHPAGAVAAIFQPVQIVSGRATMTARGLQSFLHEFGHAIHHILLDDRRPSRGGLDYASLERIDSISTWFEQWVQHPVFKTNAVDDGAAEDGSFVVEMLHRRSLLARAIYASFDLEVHADPDRFCGEVFDDVTNKYGTPEVSFDDILQFLSWPMQQRNPGGEVGILWAWAEAAIDFRQFRHERISDLAGVRSSICDALNGPRAADVVTPDARLEFLRRW